MADAVASMAYAAKEDFTVYYEDITVFFFKMLESHKSPEYRELRGKIIQTLIIVFVSIKWPNYKKYSINLIDCMLTI